MKAGITDEFFCTYYTEKNGAEIGDIVMGKYVLAWFLGVPGIVLVIIYFIMN